MPFSLLIDASFDIYNYKCLSLLARYINEEEESGVTKLFEMIEIKASSTGEEYYGLIEEEIFDRN